MEHYRDALEYLNRAMDAMIAEGDLTAVANISYPIALMEQEILRRRTDSINRMALCAVPARR